MLAQGFLDLFCDAAPHLEYSFQLFELCTKAAFAKAALWHSPKLSHGEQASVVSRKASRHNCKQKCSTCCKQEATNYSKRKQKGSFANRRFWRVHPRSSFLYCRSAFCTLVPVFGVQQPRFCTLVPVFVPSFRVLGSRNIRQNHPFGNRPFANPRIVGKIAAFFFAKMGWGGDCIPSPCLNVIL